MSEPHIAQIINTALASNEPVVVLMSIRGKEDVCQLVAGIGGIPSGQLLSFDLMPKGSTWLWERLDNFLTQLAQLLKHSPLNARILLLDLSGSMKSQLGILKRMWASVPSRGVAAQGCEIMVCSDGQDVQSAGEFHGANGLMALLRHCSELGWDVGEGGPLGKLFITLLDVGNGKASRELAQHGHAQAMFMHTQELDLVARIVRSPRPQLSGLLNEQQLQSFAPLQQAELEEIQAVEKFLSTEGRAFDLSAMVDMALGSLTEPIRGIARSKCLSFLDELLKGQCLQVNKRGEQKAFHSAINSLLYQLQPFGIVQHQGAPRIWSRDLMFSYALEPLEQLRNSIPSLELFVNRLLMDESEVDNLQDLAQAKAVISCLLEQVRR